VIKKPVEVEDILQQAQQEDDNARTDLQAQIQALLDTTSLLPLDEFIQPPGEVIEDLEKDVFARVVEHHSTVDKAKQAEDEVDIEVKAKPAISAVLEALELLNLYKLIADDGEVDNIKVFEKMEKRVTASKTAAKKQMSIQGWLKPN